MSVAQKAARRVTFQSLTLNFVFTNPTLPICRCVHLSMQSCTHTLLHAPTQCINKSNLYTMSKEADTHRDSHTLTQPQRGVALSYLYTRQALPSPCLAQLFWLHSKAPQTHASLCPSAIWTDLSPL